MRPVCLVACIALVVSCTKETGDNSTGPVPVGIPLPTLMISCSITPAGADSFDVTAPGQLACDSTGTPDPLSDTTARCWYRVRGDSFKVALKGLSPVIRRVMAGPSFTSEVAGFLDMLDTIETGIFQLLGVFMRVEGDSVGLPGLWRFAGLQPSFIEDLLSGAQKEALEAMLIDADGKASMMFELTADSLIGLLSRRTYGDAVLDGQIDTAAYGMRYGITGDSTWRVCGNISMDTAEMMVDGNGDLYWTWGESTHVYYQRPSGCPNTPAPSWLQIILAANPG